MLLRPRVTSSFFQLRRSCLDAFADPAPAKLQAAEKLCRDWLRAPGNDSARKPTPEAVSVRFYLAIDLQLQCVSTGGVSCRVSRTISSTLSAGIDGFGPRPGRPGEKF